MPNIEELQTRLQEVQAGLDAMCAKNQILYKEIAHLKKLFVQEKRAWVGLEEKDLIEMGVDGPVKFTWVSAAEDKLKQLNS